MRYVVLGNGIISLTIAFELLKMINTQDEIVIIGPSSRIGGATLSAAAMLNSYAEISPYCLKSEYSKYHFELSRLATNLWPDFETEVTTMATSLLSKNTEEDNQHINRLYLQKGTYIINNSATNDWDDRSFEAIIRTLEKYGELYEIISAKDIPNYSPSQYKRATRGLFIPNEGWLNPNTLVTKLDFIFAQHDQVKLINNKVKHLNIEVDTISSVTLENGVGVYGDTFLVATGSNTQSIIENSDLGIEIQPIFYGTGISLEVQCEDLMLSHCIRTPNRGGACGIYTAPYVDGRNKNKNRMIIGASNRLQPKPQYYGRLSSIEYLISGAVEEINEYFYSADLVKVNVGWRPTSQDTYPLLGQSSIENLFFATGTKRNGFHLSPVISRFMSRLMTYKTTDPRFSMFNPEREPIRDISRSDAIEMIVSSLMSEQYQHGYRPSGPLMNNQLVQSYKSKVEELHDNVGCTDWGIHPELVNMYRDGYARF